MAAREEEPSKALEKREMKDQVLAAVRALPEREVRALFYIDGYWQGDSFALRDMTITLTGK